jgi:predicted small lipoprotein YifL
MFRIRILLVLALVFSITAHAQKTPKEKTPSAKADTVKTDAAKKTTSDDPKAYSDVITKEAITSIGMFNVHRIKEQFFFEIPDSLLNRDILIVNRIAKSAAGLRPNVNAYAGDHISENVIRFDLGPSNRIFMRRMIFSENSVDSTDNGMYRAVVKSNLQPIVASFPVKAYGTDTVKSKSYIIDVTSFLQGENEIFYFSPRTKKSLSVGAVQNDKSYIASIKSYPVNMEIYTIRTYTSVTAPNTTASTLPVSYELNSSMLLLPKIPMKSRYMDDRVGYFARRFVSFDANPQGIKNQAVITRWRLEPRDEDKDRYLKGELVEPKTPIIYYIDPATPKKWVPYLIAGVNDWQTAFEQAGFKNAIKGLPAPENDSTWNINDARHNVIVYKASSIPNASGPHVHDPRSGEIMETHINWYHNIMSLLHNWYMIQVGAVDARARKMQFDDELMGQLIRFVSSHEVGHTLGLRHNFGSSSTVPVEKLRDRAYVEKYGHTPSIMDYARFNYIAQPEDGISEKGLFPRIGEYDKWAIEWGYRWLPQFDSPDEETEYLNKLIMDSLTANNKLFFGNESEPLDPRSQNEDLGNNAMKASVYGIKNLQRILPNLKKWTWEPNDDYSHLKNMYEELLGQYRRYTRHVLKNVGGEYHTPKKTDESGSVYELVEYEKQKEAMQFLDTYLFSTQTWLIDDSIISLTGYNISSYIKTCQSGALSRLQNSDMLNRMIKNEELHRGVKTYPVSEFMEDLKKSVWRELYTHRPIDIHRRSLQKIYIENTFTLLKNADSDDASLIRAHLIALKKDIKKAIGSQKNMSKYHLQDVLQRIENQLKTKN